MSHFPPNTHDGSRADTPLALKSNEGLGRKIPARVAFDRWQADSPPELWQSNRASLGSTAWEAYRAGWLERENRLELVGWQCRWLDPDEGPGLWVFCDYKAVEVYRRDGRYDVRPVYGQRPNVGAKLETTAAPK